MSCTYSSLQLKYFLFYSLLSFFLFLFFDRTTLLRYFISIPVSILFVVLLPSHFLVSILYQYAEYASLLIIVFSSYFSISFYFHLYLFLFLYIYLILFLTTFCVLLSSSVISLYYILFAFSLIFLSQSSNNELKWKNIPLVVKLPSISSFITEF